MKKEYIAINVGKDKVTVIEKVCGEITSGTGEMPVDKIITSEYTIVDGQLVLSSLEEIID